MNLIFSVTVYRYHSSLSHRLAGRNGPEISPALCFEDFAFIIVYEGLEGFALLTNKGASSKNR
jgi:hypothetical protein